MAALSDLVIEIFLGESAVLRAMKVRGRSAAHGAHADLALVWVNDGAARLSTRAREAAAALAEGAELAGLLGRLDGLLRWTPRNAFLLRRRVADRLGVVGGYPALIGAA
jgi:hypothetical protein